jgi:dsRNA-specific ribonuclease
MGMGDVPLGQGTGKNKQLAQQEAAGQALRRLDEGR